MKLCNFPPLAITTHLILLNFITFSEGLNSSVSEVYSSSVAMSLNSVTNSTPPSQSTSYISNVKPTSIISSNLVTSSSNVSIITGPDKSYTSTTTNQTSNSRIPTPSISTNVTAATKSLNSVTKSDMPPSQSTRYINNVKPTSIISSNLFTSSSSVNTTTGPDKTEKGLSTAEIGGIAGGVAGAVVILIILSVVLCMKKSRKERSGIIRPLRNVDENAEIEMGQENAQATQSKKSE